MARKSSTATEPKVSAVSATRKRASSHAKHSAATPVEGPSLAAEPPVTEPVEMPTETASEPTCEEIAKLAYSYWEARGYQGGSPDEDWLRAERELRERQSVAATA